MAKKVAKKSKTQKGTKHITKKRSRSQKIDKRKIINFVSGNKNKLRELNEIINEHIKDIEIKQLDIDLP